MTRARGALLVMLVAGACHRGPSVPRPVVTRLEVRDRSRGTLLDRDALARGAADALKKSNLFEVVLEDPPRPGSWRCRLDVAAGAEEAGGEGMLHAAAELECGPSGGSGADQLAAQTLGDKSFKKQDGAIEILLRAHALRLVQDTVGLVVRQRKLRTGPPAELVAALRDSDADVRRMAIRAAAARRAREAVGELTRLLDDSQEDVREIALGALIEIRDPSAVKAITSRVKFQDTEELRRIIDPVGAMGGDEARAFLEFVASGHEDADIRKQAKTALERMDRTTGAKR